VLHYLVDLTSRQIVVGNERFNDIAFLLDQTSGSLQPFKGQDRVVYKGGAFAIQFDLVHSLQMTPGGKKIRIHLVLDREVKLEIPDSIYHIKYGVELVKVLESFTGKRCQFVGRYSLLLDEAS